MKKNRLILILVILITFLYKDVYAADDFIADLQDEDSVVMLNESLRKKTDDIQKNTTDIDTNVTDIATNTAAIAALYDKAIQVVHTITKTVITNSPATVLPIDNTAPTNSEGDLYLTRTITPKATTNYLVVFVSIMISNAHIGGAPTAIVLFDGTSPVAVGMHSDGSTVPITTSYCYIDDSASIGTSEKTFTVRVGHDSNDRVTMNGDSSGNQLFGGVATSSITIFEIEP